MSNSNELMVRTDNGQAIDFSGFNVNTLLDTTNSYLALFAEDAEPARAEMFNALQTPTGGVGDLVNTTFTLKGLVCHSVKITNEETGEVNDLPRMILFTDKGSFGSVSLTLFSSIKNLLAVYGNLTQTKGIKVNLKQINKGSKRYYSLTVAEK